MRSRPVGVPDSGPMNLKGSGGRRSTAGRAELLTPQEAGNLMGVSACHVVRLIQRGVLDGYRRKAGKSLRYGIEIREAARFADARKLYARGPLAAIPPTGSTAAENGR